MATCYANQLEYTLRQKMPAVLLLWGEDAGAIRQSAEMAVEMWGVDVNDTFAAEKIPLAALEETPSRLPDSAATVPLGGGKRLIRLSGISGDEGAGQISALTDAVKTTLTLPLQDILIILPLPRVVEKSSPLVKAVEGAAGGLSVRFFLPTVRDIGEWLQKEFKTAGKRAEPEAMALLTDHLGADQEQTRREVEKLLLYVGNAETVTADDVRASLSGAIPADIFRLAEAVGGRDTRQTDRLLTCLLEEGQDLNAAFSITLRHLNLLKAAQTMRRQGATEDDILKNSGKARAPKTAKAAFMQQVKTYPAGRLETLPAYAVETFAAARGGTLNGDVVLSRALLALAV